MDVTTINNYLKRYNLFSFQHRMFFRIVIFANKLLNNTKAPINLRSQLKFNYQRELLYVLRNNNKLISSIITHTKYGSLTFSYFFPKLLNLFNLKYENFNLLKKTLLLNLNNFYDLFIQKFNIFNVTCKYFI